MARNRQGLKRKECARCGGAGQVDGLADCADCQGSGVAPTVAELRQRLSACEAEAAQLRELAQPLTNELAALMENVRQLLRLAEREERGGK